MDFRKTCVLALALSALTPLRVSAAFPRLAGTDLATGQPTELAIAPAKRAAVVVFLSTKCPCSRDHEATLKGLAAAHREIAFVGVHSNTDESEAEAREHFRAAGLGFPVLQDAGTKLADEYRALKTPHVFVIGPDGSTLYRGGVDDSRHAGKANRHYLADALTAIAAGRAPETAEARALGCYIKR